jgi:acrylyl-CoA reductase (NADPH)
MNLHRTMFFGTAGFTAALAIHRMIQNNQTPEKGPILVTGATGGVGNFSIAILNHLGFEVWALTGKKSVRTDQLKKLGAHEVMTEEELNLGTKPLEKAKFGGAIDNIGGKLLPKILAHTQLWGNVSSIGLAAGHQFETTVMPFILRGVSLLGVSSNNCPLPLRREIWRKLSQEWNCPAFNQIAVEEITLEDILEKSKQMLARNTSGRTVVRIRS